MKRYFITLALLLLLLTLLIPSSLPTATAAPLNDTDKEYHPGINAKQLKVYQKAVKTADCGDLPPMACTPDGPNDPGDQEKLIHDRIIPGGTTVDEITITNNPPTEHYQYEKCGYPAEQWRETNYDQVDLSLGYPPEYTEQPDTIRGYKQGFKDRITITGLWILPPYHHPDCEKALHGTAIEETNLSGRYTLTDAPDSDGDGVADEYDACIDDPGPASSDGCPSPETWDCGDGVTIPEAALPNLAEVAEILGFTFDPDNPCAILDEELDDFSMEITDTKEVPLSTKGAERCLERGYTIDIRVGPLNSYLGTLEAGYSYCTDGLIVYGNPGDTSSQPILMAQVDGDFGVPAIYQVVCQPVSAVGARWRSYEGQNKGSFVTDATSRCTVNYGTDFWGISFDTTFIVNFTLTVFATDEDEIALVNIEYSVD